MRIFQIDIYDDNRISTEYVGESDVLDFIEAISEKTTYSMEISCVESPTASLERIINKYSKDRNNEISEKLNDKIGTMSEVEVING